MKMKMKQYYITEPLDAESCKMISGPMTYMQAYEIVSSYSNPKYFLIVHRWVEVEVPC